MAFLLILFVVVPAVELYLLIQVGREIGALETLGIIVLTGFIGAALARYQGIEVLRKIQGELGQGKLPTASLADGLILLVAAAVLITPGFLTDLFGFLCLIPFTRRLIRAGLMRWLATAAREKRVRFTVSGGEGFRDPFAPGGGTPGPRPDLESDEAVDLEERDGVWRRSDGD